MLLRLLLIPIALGVLSCAPKPLEIPAELRAKFWRIRAEHIAAENAVEKARAADLAMEAELKKFCGHDAVFAQGELSCGK